MKKNGQIDLREDKGRDILRCPKDRVQGLAGAFYQEQETAFSITPFIYDELP